MEHDLVLSLLFQNEIYLYVVVLILGNLKHIRTTFPTSFCADFADI